MKNIEIYQGLRKIHHSASYTLGKALENENRYFFEIIDLKKFIDINKQNRGSYHEFLDRACKFYADIDEGNEYSINLLISQFEAFFIKTYKLESFKLYFDIKKLCNYEGKYIEPEKCHLIFNIYYDNDTSKNSDYLKYETATDKPLRQIGTAKNYHQSRFWHEYQKYLKSQFPEFKPCLDFEVYKKNHQMRTIGSLKNGTNKFLTTNNSKSNIPYYLPKYGQFEGSFDIYNEETRKSQTFKKFKVESYEIETRQENNLASFFITLHTSFVFGPEIKYEEPFLLEAPQIKYRVRKYEKVEILEAKALLKSFLENQAILKPEKDLSTRSGWYELISLCKCIFGNGDEEILEILFKIFANVEAKNRKLMPKYDLPKDEEETKELYESLRITWSPPIKRLRKFLGIKFRFRELVEVEGLSGIHFKDALTWEDMKITAPRYFKLPHKIENDKSIYVIKSAMGTGKTNYILNELSGQKVLYISYRKNLANEISNKYEFINYQTSKYFEEAPQKLAVQLESLNKYFNILKDYDYVIFDESEHIADQLENLRPEKIIDTKKALIYLLKNKTCFFISASLGYKTACFISYFGNVSPYSPRIRAIKNKFKPFTDREIIRLETPNEVCRLILDLAGKTKENGQPNKICCPISKVKDLKWIEYNIKNKYPEKKILVLTSDTPDNEKQRIIGNINEEFQNYDIILHSPSVEAGNSFDPKNCFDYIIGLFSDYSSASWSMNQMLHRIRNPTSKKIYLYVKEREYVGEDETLIFESRRMIELKFKDKKLANCFSVCDDDLEGLDWNDPINRMLYKLKTIKQKDKKNLARNLLKGLEKSGYKISAGSYESLCPISRQGEAKRYDNYNIRLKIESGEDVETVKKLKESNTNITRRNLDFIEDLGNGDLKKGLGHFEKIMKIEEALNKPESEETAELAPEAKFIASIENFMNGDYKDLTEIKQFFKDRSMFCVAYLTGRGKSFSEAIGNDNTFIRWINSGLKKYGYKFNRQNKKAYSPYFLSSILDQMDK